MSEIKYISDVIREIQKIVDKMREEGGFSVEYSYSLSEDNNTGSISFEISTSYDISDEDENT